MKQYRIVRKNTDSFWIVERKVWWGWKYEGYAIRAEAALDYIKKKLEETGTRKIDKNDGCLAQINNLPVYEELTPIKIV